MYGNIESSQPGGQKWVPGPGGEEACCDLCPMEENPYEPLDPPITAPSRKHVPEPPVSPTRQSCPQDKLLLVGAVALGVSVLLNVFLLSLGTRQIATLTAALDEAEKQQPNSNTASRSFLLYNKAHDLCVEARDLYLTAATCNPNASTQRFQWLPGNRLRNAGNRLCITAVTAKNTFRVWLQSCRDDGRLQRWECGDGGLLALEGHELYFNYGNNKERSVMLYIGDREWSRWVVHGSSDDVCTRLCCPPCSKGWTYFGDSCYFYSKTTSTWEDARRFCSALGTQLLEVDGPEEKAHVRTMLQGSSWLGIRDQEAEGTWKRANGSILSQERSSWQEDEPNGGQGENCAVVQEDGLWYDYPCTQQHPWVCEGHP